MVQGVDGGPAEVKDISTALAIIATQMPWQCVASLSCVVPELLSESLPEAA